MRILALLLLMPLVTAQPARVSARWTETPCSKDGTAALHRAARRVLRVVDREGKDVGDAPSPPDVRMQFGLEKTTFLLGEPILARLSVTVRGEGAWREWSGGNYRARGRDGNFLFLMQRSDGSFLPDTYGKVRFYRGGRIRRTDITEGKPLALWACVQRWCPIDAPGDYALHAFYSLDGGEVFGARPEGLEWGPLEVSPLSTALDPAVRKRVLANHWHLDGLGCYARIPIVIRPGLPADRVRMVSDVLARVRSSVKRPVASRDAALVDGVTFARQDDFLDLISEQYRDGEGLGWLTAGTGLSVRTSKAATAVLVSGGPAKALGDIGIMSRQNAIRLMPRCIEWIGHRDEEVRKQVLHALRYWAGEAAPASDDQGTWLSWWKTAEAGFVPAPFR